MCHRFYIIKKRISLIERDSSIYIYIVSPQSPSFKWDAVIIMPSHSLTLLESRDALSFAVWNLFLLLLLLFLQRENENEKYKKVLLLYMYYLVEHTILIKKNISMCWLFKTDTLQDFDCRAENEYLSTREKKKTFSFQHLK